MSYDLLERGAHALGDLVDEAMFVGGATLVLWINDPAAAPLRPTRDVDVVVEIVSRPALHRFEKLDLLDGVQNAGRRCERSA